MSKEDQSTPLTETKDADYTNGRAKRLHSALSPDVHESSDDINRFDMLELMHNLQETLMKGMENLSVKIDTVDRKIENVATKDDLVKITNELTDVKAKVSALEEENSALKHALNKVIKDQDLDRKKIQYLEEQVKKKSLILRNIPANRSVKEAAQSVCRNNLKMQNNVEIITTRWLGEKQDKMTVAVELATESMVDEVLKHAKNLAGTAISISRDLTSEKQQQRKAMVQLKSQLLGINESKQVLIRENKLKVDDKWYHWNQHKRLVCGKADGLRELTKSYGDAFASLPIISYDDLLQKSASKNPNATANQNF